MLLKSLYLFLESQDYARKHWDRGTLDMVYAKENTGCKWERDAVLEKSVRKERRLDLKEINVEGSRKIGLGICLGTLFL